MADINDFKTINIKSRKMYDLIGLDNSLELTEVQKTRLGFYHLILENITGLNEKDEINEIIIDTDYNKIVNNVEIDDLGIDAVYINDDNKDEIEISLFNFKFRENFKPEKTKSENDLSISTKFLHYITSSVRLYKVNKIIQEKIKKIRTFLNGNTICNITLYMVSNEPKGFNASSDDYIRLLENSYGMKVVSISLDEIIGFFSEVKEDQKCKFNVSRDDCFPFNADEKTTKKSYIIKMSLIDLIRITSSNSEMANNYNLENDAMIKECYLDLSLLYDNVRGYLGNTKYNLNIYQTLEKSHKNFFLFNNGITITAKDIECTDINSGQRYLFEVYNFQIVNGGQTIRSIYNYLHKSESPNKYSNLREAYILVRFFKISKDDLLKNNIAEYTNSQNSISPMDLKSVDYLQIQIERYLREEKILYVRKAGHTGDSTIDYKYRISMERLAKIIYSIMGYPDRAINKKRRLFLDWYNSIFKNGTFNVEFALKLTTIYRRFEIFYKKHRPDIVMSEQKIIYAIYMVQNFKLKPKEAVDKLQDILKSYKKEASEARKLIYSGFKMHLDTELSKSD